MEEQRDLNSTDSSEGESVSPSPSLPSPPILPLQVAQQAHRTTNFFIDNILRPDFGCKKEHGLASRERAQTSGRERVHSVVNRPSLPGTPCQDSNCSSDSTTSSTSSTSLASPRKSNGSGGESRNRRRLHREQRRESRGENWRRGRGEHLLVACGAERHRGAHTGDPAAALACLGLLHPVLGQALICRPKDTETEKIEKR
uniref:Engrailed homeobox 1b n=1 Tax=Lates calcarifer TaxID=8187 RepID=A0A4W6E1C8_LATCA